MQRSRSPKHLLKSCHTGLFLPFTSMRTSFFISFETQKLTFYFCRMVVNAETVLLNFSKEVFLKAKGAFGRDARTIYFTVADNDTSSPYANSIPTIANVIIFFSHYFLFFVNLNYNLQFFRSSVLEM